jgi:hypothetical protein
VISIAGDVVITRGDNAPADDAPVARERVLGVVTHAERDGEMLRVRRLSRLAVFVERGVRRLCRRFLTRRRRAPRAAKAAAEPPHSS